MRALLELCIEMDTFAEQTYTRMAEACEDPGLARTLVLLSKEEAVHVGWWRHLLQAWEDGLIPDLAADSELIDRLLAVFAKVRSEVPEDARSLTSDEMLATAIRMEFFMLDPVFGELVDLTEPGQSGHRREAYGAHLQRLIDTVTTHYEPGSIVSFLAAILSRTWRDNLSLATYASRDSLTGILNRRALDTHLPQWAAWSARYGRPLAILLIDIDEFKRVNDAYGHATGDVALAAVSGALARAVRSSDLLVRYGGDEFAVIAPETDAAHYRQLVERIVETVRALEIHDAGGRPVSVTVSVGGAIADDPPGSSARPADRLLAAADHALYEAKRAGRNRASEPAVLDSIVTAR